MNRNFMAMLTTSLLLAGLMAGCSTPSTTAPDSQANNPPVEDVSSEEAPSQESSVYAEDGIAIKGYDPVAYFQQGAPVKGSPDYTYDWMETTWQFASAENRDLFVSNPEQYAPQYGGYCAWAVSQGYVAPIDPNAWSIVGDKLYLNYSPDVQATWQEDIPGNIEKADENWPEVLAK
jgi:YHS domain-containing protein